MTTTLSDELVHEARVAAEAADSARQQMNEASDRRAEAVFALWSGGMPIRRIAEVTSVSPAVTQRLLEKARASRPHLSRREERVSYELHKAVADKLRRDPAPVLSKARSNLRAMALRVRDPYAQGWVDEWSRLMDAGNMEDLLRVMLSFDERGIDLRQMTPFAGVLTQGERMVAIQKATRGSK